MEDLGDGLGSDGEDDQGEAWEVGPPVIFSTQRARRLFIVQNIARALTGCRPSFEFEGFIVEVAGGKDFSDLVQSRKRLQKSDNLVESGLTLSLRYEPPSPKFSRHCPEFTSYRVRVWKGEEFLYSTRGLQRQMQIDSSSLIVVWGNLELAFSSGPELSKFLAAIRYVDMCEDPRGLLANYMTPKKTAQPRERTERIPKMVEPKEVESNDEPIPVSAPVSFAEAAFGSPWLLASVFLGGLAVGVALGRKSAGSLS